MARHRAVGDISGRTGTAGDGTRSGPLDRAESAPPVASTSAGAILGRRAGPATPRTIIGGLLVAAAAIVVFAIAMATGGGSKTAYAVAAHALPAGSIIGPGDLTTATMSLSGGTKTSAFTSTAGLVGRTVAVPVGTGQLIESPMLSAPSGTGLRPVSVAVDGNSLLSLSPGNAVDVLAFPSSNAATPGGTGASATAAEVVLRGATLMSVNHSGSGLLGAPSTGSSMVVTLGVSDLSEAEAVITAAHSGTVELVLAEPADGSGAGAGS